MARMLTSRVLIATAIGGVAGFAFVWNDDWFTQLVGFLVGAIGMIFTYIAMRFCVEQYLHKSLLERTDHTRTTSDDYDQRAYRIERIFMDDGKPW